MVRFRFDPFELDARNFELRRSGALVPIQPKAFDLLACLVRRHGELVTKSELMEAVWPGLSVTKDSLAQAMMGVRVALGDDVTEGRYVQTVRGRGYRFVAPVHEVDREAARAAPAPSTRADRAALVGRSDALALADELLARAPRTGSLLFVAGEAGLGKTAFLAAVGSRAASTTPIAVRCSSDAGAPDLWPFVQVARELRRLGASLAPETTSLAEGRITAGALEDPKSRFRFGERLAADVIRLATRAPVVLSFDDLHLADAATLAMLRAVVPLLRTAPVVTVAAYRPRTAREKSFEAVVGELSREPLARLVTLEPLGREEVAAFVELRAGHRPEPAVLDKLVDKTKGNPLFLSQIVHVLRTEERLKVSAPTTTLVGGDGMREAITHHLATLSDPVVHALTIAAVFGRTFAVAPLAAALEQTNESLLVALDAAEGARIVARDGAGAYRFVYPLIRDVLYKKLTTSERAELHGRAAAALEHRLEARPAHQHVGEIARHRVEAAAAGEVEPAIDWSLRAARAAVEAGDAAAAAAYAQRGLEALGFAQRPDEKRRRELLAFASRR